MVYVDGGDNIDNSATYIMSSGSRKRPADGSREAVPRQHRVRLQQQKARVPRDHRPTVGVSLRGRQQRCDAGLDRCY